MSHSVKEQLHARACDGCARRRARWYCAADDAFLCQHCDASVHSANPLARRHERLRLKTGSLSVLNLDTPAWPHRITRKARTPRPKPSGAVVKSEPVVPDLETVSADENNTEEEQLLYCVPVFDHSREEKPFVGQVESNNSYKNVTEDDVELTEFAADMERLLGRGIEEDAFCMEGLGFLDLKDENHHEIKSEVEDEKMVMESRHQMDIGGVDLLSRETLELNLDYMSTEIEEEEEEAEKVNDGGKRLILRLDYEKVINAWSSSDGSSPWADGERPRINPDECWHYFMGGMWGGGGGMGQVGGGDGGREARVTRYREKKRTRLFSKKIRYEVRKLNAEKRPRMKGRFVKRVSVASSGFSSY